MRLMTFSEGGRLSLLIFIQRQWINVEATQDTLIEWYLIASVSHVDRHNIDLMEFIAASMNFNRLCLSFTRHISMGWYLELSYGTTP